MVHTLMKEKSLTWTSFKSFFFKGGPIDMDEVEKFVTGLHENYGKIARFDFGMLSKSEVN
jgi:hypothetical protein